MGMNEEQIITLDDETFKEIYSNEKLRNAVAFAHTCLNSDNKFLHKKALMYPISYKVTEEQIKVSNDLRLKTQREVLIKNYNKLLFCGMGMEFKPTFKDGVGNYRIRTHFINDEGIECFIEFGKGTDEFFTIDHAIFNYIDNTHTLRERDKQINNYLGLERNTPKLKYTFKNILNIVNKYFNCQFKEVVLDYYNIRCDNVLCRSPIK